MAPLKRHAYDAEFKLKAISHADEHGNRAAAREFNVNESMVRKWRKQQDDLRRAKKTKKSFRGNKARWLQLEDKLEQWVVEQRAASGRVSTTTIRMKATALASELNINEFKGGTSWCFRFMKRRNISIRPRTNVSEQLPEDYEEELATFRAYCKNEITEEMIRPEHIINMDEDPLTFDIPVNRTVDETGARTVNVRTTGNENLKQEMDSSMDQEEPELPQVKKEQEEPCTSQEGEQLVLKQEPDACMWTTTYEENNHSEDQTLHMKPGQSVTQKESVVSTPVTSSVIGAANSDLKHLRVTDDLTRNMRIQTDCPLYVCKEEKEVPADQQLWKQEMDSSMGQEEPELPQVKREQEEPCTSQEGEQLVLKQEPDACMWTTTYEENNHSEDQTLHMKPGQSVTQKESVVSTPVISSVIAANGRCITCGRPFT